MEAVYCKRREILVLGQFVRQLYSDEDILLQKYRRQVRAYKSDNRVHEFQTLFEVTLFNQGRTLRMCLGTMSPTSACPFMTNVRRPWTYVNK